MNVNPVKAKIAFLIAASILLFSCNNDSNSQKASKEEALPIVGTWQLISGSVTDNKGTVVTDYTKNQKAIKIINGSHFCFLIHDLNKGKGPSPSFTAGGGKYTLNGNNYTEFLEYCNDRQWENNKFSFTVSIKNDTLIQKGIEKIDSIGVNRVNVEKYARVK